MLHTLGLLLACQLLGEIIVRGFGFAMPGPVLGLALLVLLLWAFPKLAEQLRPTTAVILANLSFLFVPAGVGVIGNFDVLLDDRNARPGVMFADAELIGIPHRLVISERGLAAGELEYRRRGDSESKNLKREEALKLL